MNLSRFSAFSTITGPAERKNSLQMRRFQTISEFSHGLDPKGPLFRTIGRGTAKLTRTVLPQANAYAMIGRRAAAAGIATKLGNHSFRATGITAYLKNGGTLEKAAAMAGQPCLDAHDAALRSQAG
jgi:integrase